MIITEEQVWALKNIELFLFVPKSLFQKFGGGGTTPHDSQKLLITLLAPHQGVTKTRLAMGHFPVIAANRTSPPTLFEVFWSGDRTNVDWYSSISRSGSTFSVLTILSRSVMTDELFVKILNPPLPLGQDLW